MLADGRGRSGDGLHTAASPLSIQLRFISHGGPRGLKRSALARNSYAEVIMMRRLVLGRDILAIPRVLGTATRTRQNPPIPRPHELEGDAISRHG